MQQRANIKNEHDVSLPDKTGALTLTKTSFSTSTIEMGSDDLETLGLIPSASNSNMLQKLVGCCRRSSILVTGLSLGFITFMPNGMMSDDGSTLAVTFSSIGLCASFSFIVGGIVGAISKKWSALLPGTILQLVALSPMIIYGLLFGWDN
jgi:hypothetical protein